MKKISKYLLLASFIGTFAEVMLIPIWGHLVDRVGGDINESGIGWGLALIVTGIIVVIFGRTKWYEDNVQSMVFWGFLLSGIGDFLFIFVKTVDELFVVQCLIGLAVGLLGPAWDSLYTDDGNTLSTHKWSFWTGGISFVSGVGAITGSLILSYFGWSAVFIVMGMFDLVAVYYGYKVLIN